VYEGCVQINLFAFGIFIQTTIGFVVSVCLSPFCAQRKIRLKMNGYFTFDFGDVFDTLAKKSSFIKICQKYGYIYWRSVYIHESFFPHFFF